MTSRRFQAAGVLAGVVLVAALCLLRDRERAAQGDRRALRAQGEQVDPASPPSASRPEGRVAAPVRQGHGLAPEQVHGQVQVLSVRDLRPPVGSEWLARSTDAAAEDVRFRVGSSPQALSTGWWTMDSIDSAYSTSGGPLRVTAGRVQVLWVSPLVEGIRVLDDAGAPLAGATLFWLPRRSAASVPLERYLVEGIEVERTGEDGIARLAAAGGVGRLLVAAVGWRPRAAVVAGEPPATIELEREGGPRPMLRFVAAGEADRPLHGVWIELGGEPITSPSGSSGEAAWRLPLPEGELALIRGAETMPGFLRLRTWAPGEERPFALAVRCPVELRAPARGLPAGARIWLEMLEPTEGADSEAILPDEMRWTGAPIVTDLPAGSRMRVHVLVPEGGCATEEFRVELPGCSVTLGSIVERFLIVEVRSSDGREIAVQVDVERDAGAPRDLDAARNDREGASVRVAAPDSIRRLKIGAEGYEVLTLMQRGEDGGADPAGKLDLVLRPAHDFTLLMRDEDEEPLDGIAVRAWPHELEENFRSHPELNGGRPTSHPAWTIQPAAFDGHSVERGVARLGGLPAGRYAMTLSLEAALHARSGGIDLWSPPGKTVHISSETERLLVLPRPRRLSLEVVDGTSGRSLDAFRVEPEATAIPGQVAQARGNPWQGWIRADSPGVWISAAGAGRIYLPLDPDAEDWSHRVVLSAELPTLVRLAGAEVEALDGEHVRFSVELPYVAADGSAMSSIQWQEGFDWPGGESVELQIPGFREGAVLRLSLGPGWRVEPSRVPLRRGEPHGFEVTRGQ